MRADRAINSEESSTICHSIQCRCGSFSGKVLQTRGVNHGLCYCLDCQAFAHFLGRPEEILDERGGTEIVQTTPQNVAFTEGLENLTCMRLTPNGLMRWHTRCCNTPIGNTSPNYRIPFVGLVHSCLRNGQTSLDDAFGPIGMRVYTKYAKGEPKPQTAGLLPTIVRFARMILKARISGGYKTTPFFVAETGAPVVIPRVLSDQERAELMRAVAR